jgi:hypothetical protein
MALACTVAAASGGNVRAQNPIITDDGCILSIPKGVDAEACEQVVDGDTNVWFCDDYEIDATIVCDD